MNTDKKFNLNIKTFCEAHDVHTDYGLSICISYATPLQISITVRTLSHSI